MRNYRELEQNYHIGEVTELLKEFSAKSTNPKLKALNMHVIQLIIAVSSYEMERQGFDRTYDKAFNELTRLKDENIGLKKELEIITNKKL
tara:strand:- start:1622 stop:1891 length:270 start_codon:yes stop_codon:yes gene_type:complete